jgi:hypothetical protein
VLTLQHLAAKYEPITIVHPGRIARRRRRYARGLTPSVPLRTGKLLFYQSISWRMVGRTAWGLTPGVPLLSARTLALGPTTEQTHVRLSFTLG